MRSGRTEERRIQDLQAAALRDPGGPVTGGALVVQTATKDTYPAAAAAYYYCEIVAVSGAEVEGGTATLTALGQYLYAYNVGSAVPAAGTTLLAVPDGRGRWTISYNG